MSFNQFKYYVQKTFGQEITENEFYIQVNEAIEKIKTAVELAGNLKKIAIECIDGIVYSIKFGIYPHGITNEKLKTMIEVFDQMVELSHEDEKIKNTYKFLADIAKRKIDENSNRKRW